MYKKLSFDSEASNCSSDIEEIETKEQTHDEEVQKQFPNINLIKAIAQTLETILEDNKNFFSYFHQYFHSDYNQLKDFYYNYL